MVIGEKIIVPAALGLHLRSAAKLVLLMSRYQCEVTVRNDHRSANAKSIIGLISLGAAAGMELFFNFQGDDAEEASLVVREFFQKSSDE